MKSKSFTRAKRAVKSGPKTARFLKVCRAREERRDVRHQLRAGAEDILPRAKFKHGYDARVIA